LCRSGWYFHQNYWNGLMYVHISFVRWPTCAQKIAAKPLLILQISNFQSHVFFSGDVSHFPCNPKIFQVISLATKNFPIEFLCSKGWVSKMCDSVIDILYSDHCSKRNWFGKFLGHKGNDLGHKGNKRRYWNL
jgi:hypothetical protein